MNPHAWWDEPTTIVDDTNHQAVAPPPGRATSTSSTSSTRRRPPAATHQIVAAGETELVNLVKPDGPDDEAPAGGVRGDLTDAWRGLRFVGESPGSLMDQIEFALDGAYTIRKDGPWRLANIWYARLVAVPGLTLCYFIAWALFTRLSRMLTSIPAILLLAWVLNNLPITGWVVPDWLDITTWFAAADPTLPPGAGE